MLLVSFMAVTTRERARLTWGEEVLREFFAPVQGVMSEATRSIGRAIYLVVNVGRLAAENERLYKELARLMSENNRLEEYKLESERLSRLLQFKEAVPHDTVAARVIARDPSNWLSTFVIDKGRRYGIAKDMVVIAPEGLVGRVTSVTEDTATVWPIVDPQSAVGGIIQRSRTLVLVEGLAGEAGLCALKALTPDADIKVGDEVISSGYGGIFPKGLLIGRVQEVREARYGITKTALVKPAVDLTRLEEVLVVRKAVDGG